MRFLICGLGSIGRRHLKNLMALGQDDIVLYRTGKATLEDDMMCNFPVEHDLNEALAHWRPDAVIVSNPTAFHLDVAVPAAEAGCALLLEKPISNSMQGVDLLEQVIGAQGGRVLVGFQFRYHPGLTEVRRLLAQDCIGEVVSVSANWGEYLPDWHPWEDYRISYSARADLGGGVIHTLSHPFDYVRWIIGEVEAISAEVYRSGILDMDVEDVAEITLRFCNGILGQVHLDYLTRPPRHWLEIIGSEGSLRWDNCDGAVRWWSAASHQWQTIAAPAGFERNELFLAEMRHFIEVVKGNATPLCSFHDGLRALEVALAAHQSAEQGNRIHLPQ